MELVKRSFEAQCPKETKDVLDLIEHLSLGLIKDSKDGLDIQEILTHLTGNITRISQAVEGSSTISAEMEAHKFEMADYAVKWGADLGKRILVQLDENNKLEGEAEA